MSTSGAAAQPPGRGERLLFVDDEAPLVTVMVRLLERQGFRVAGFVDPAAALTALRADPLGFDLLVTDLNMPSMSGLEVAGAARAVHAGLPILLTSGLVTDELRAEAAAAGIAGVLYKPSSLPALIAAIRAALAGRAQ